MADSPLKVPKFIMAGSRFRVPALPTGNKLTKFGEYEKYRERYPGFTDFTRNISQATGPFGPIASILGVEGYAEPFGGDVPLQRAMSGLEQGIPHHRVERQIARG